MRRRYWLQAVGSFMALPGAWLTGVLTGGWGNGWWGVVASVGVWVVLWAGFIEDKG